MNKLIDSFNRITDHPDLARLLLRLVFGGLMLFHGVFKITHGVGWIKPMLVAHNMPTVLAYGAYIGEVIAPLLIIAGLFTRIAGLIYAINLVFAFVLVVSGELYKTTNVGAWALETEALYFFGGIIIMLLGAGKFSLSRR